MKLEIVWVFLLWGCNPNKLGSVGTQYNYGSIKLCLYNIYNIPGWWFQPLSKILVCWDDSSQYMGRSKMLQTTNQIYIYILYLRIKGTVPRSIHKPPVRDVSMFWGIWGLPHDQALRSQNWFELGLTSVKLQEFGCWNSNGFLSRRFSFGQT